MNKVDSVLLCTALFIVGMFIGAQSKKADYEINVSQNKVEIKETSTGLIYKAKHEELNDYFININL